MEIAAWHFADIDKAEPLQQLGKRLRPLPPTFTIDTGTRPHRRPHLYWRLDEPVWNMAPWTERQRDSVCLRRTDQVDRATACPIPSAACADPSSGLR